MDPGEATPLLDIVKSSTNLRVKSFGMCLISLILIFAVSNMLAPLLKLIEKAIPEDTTFNPEFVQCVFYLSGMIGAVGCGFLSSFCSRRVLLCAVCVITSSGTLLSGYLDRGMLPICRFISGVGYGGMLPIVYSLIGDWFPPKARISVSGIVSTASGFGFFLGHVVSAIFRSYSYKHPFFIIGIPLLISGIAYYKYAEEPIRGGQEKNLIDRHGTAPSSTMRYVSFHPRTDTLKALWNRTNLLVLLQAFPGNIPWGVLATFLHSFLEEEIQLSNMDTTIQASVFAMGALSGVMLGGIIGDYLYRINTRVSILFAAFCAVTRVIPAFLLLGWKDYGGVGTEAYRFLIGLTMFLTGLLSVMHVPLMGAFLLNVNLPETRGTIAGCWTMLDDVSKALGPYVIRWLKKFLNEDQGKALQISLIFWLIGGMLLIPVCETFEEDEKNMQKQLEAIAYEISVKNQKHAAEQEVTKLSREVAIAFSSSTNLK